MSGLRTTTAMALVFGIGAAVPVQAEGQTQTQNQTDRAGSWYDKLSADDLVGKDVTNATGDQVAEISDVVMDPQSRRLYAILAVGEKHVAVPMSEIAMGDDNVLIISLISEGELKSRPAYVEGQFQAIDGSPSLAEMPR